MAPKAETDRHKPSNSAPPGNSLSSGAASLGWDGRQGEAGGTLPLPLGRQVPGQPRSGVL